MAHDWLTIWTDHGSWLFDHDQRAGVYAATFRPLTMNWFDYDDYEEWEVRADSSWALEAQVGFPLPLIAHAHLTRTDVPIPLVDLDRPASLQPPPWGSHPARHSFMIFGDRSGTYGRIMHEDPPLYTWSRGPYRIDILGVAEGSTVRFPVPGAAEVESAEVTAAFYAYRLSYEGRVICARADVAVDTALEITGSVLVEMAVETLRERPPGLWPAVFSREHVDALRRLTHLPSGPYPPGTRVRVYVGDYRPDPRVAGTVVEVIRDAAGRPTGYAWRPDCFDQTAHPFADRPAQVVISQLSDVAATLDGPAPLNGLPSYRSRVVAIDDRHIAGGRLLRTRLDHEERVLRYEIQPDTPGSGPVWMSQKDLLIVSSALWTTVEEAVGARAEAGLELLPDEPLFAIRDVGIAVRGPDGTLVARTVATGMADPLLDPAAIQPSARFQLAVRPLPSADLTDPPPAPPPPAAPPPAL